MTDAGSRTADQIRAEIQAERARLGEAVGAFQANARQTGRVAGAVLAAATVARLLLRLAARRRR
jgi:hypothetical protein